MPDQPLRQLAYCSTTPQRLSRTDVLQILRSSRAYNEAVGVTGAIVYTDNSLMQVLEGEPDAVEDVYHRARRDPRHSGVMPLMDAEVGERAFPDWPMGLLRIGDVSQEASLGRPARRPQRPSGA